MPLDWNESEAREGERILRHAMEHCQTRRLVAYDKSADHAYTDAYWTIRRKHFGILRQLQSCGVQGVI